MENVYWNVFRDIQSHRQFTMGIIIPAINGLLYLSILFKSFFSFFIFRMMNELIKNSSSNIHCVFWELFSEFHKILPEFDFKILKLILTHKPSYFCLAAISFRGKPADILLLVVTRRIFIWKFISSDDDYGWRDDAKNFSLCKSSEVTSTTVLSHGCVIARLSDFICPTHSSFLILNLYVSNVVRLIFSVPLGHRFWK